jgi:PKHD-type hydroxylase
MIFSLGGYGGRYYEPFESLPDVFSAEEAERITEIGEAEGPVHATLDTPEGAVLDTEYRGCRVSWLGADGDSEFIFHRLADAARSLNEAHYHFDLMGLAEGVQYTVYEAPSVGYDWHVDIVDWPRHLTRKLSLTVQLSGEADYEGGDLLFRDGDGVRAAPRGRGAMVAFPSWTHHRVAPVTRGIRRSLVAWIGGPPFR